MKKSKPASFTALFSFLFSRRTAFFFLACLFLTSCSRKRISIHSDFVGIEHLASFWVYTPDPLLDCPPFGQRLIIRYYLPREPGEYKLALTLRYRNREETLKYFQLEKRWGTYVLCLLNDDYCKTGGILSYRLQLLKDDCVIEECRHQLFAELIELTIDPCNQELIEQLTP